jgi:glutathione S-transferase
MARLPRIPAVSRLCCYLYTLCILYSSVRCRVKLDGSGMLTLYHFWDSFCSFKVRLCLAEKGLDWSGALVDLMAFKNLEADYLAINPKGLVPVLVDGAATIPESSIINEYLDERYPETPLRPADPLARAAMRLWVQHEEEELFAAVRPASLNLMMKQVFHRYSEDELDALLANHPKPKAIGFLKKTFLAPVDEAAVASSRARLRAAFEKMDAGLAGQPWLAGATYSLADIAAAPVIDRVERLAMSDVWAGLANVTDWIARLTARPAYLRARPPEDHRMPAPRAASEQ